MVEELQTARLRLRRWRLEDRAPFAALNDDPRVMEFFPKRLPLSESDAMADRIEAHFAEFGFGLWVVERKDSPGFIGFTGLVWQRYEAHFTPCVEVGWRFSAEHWGKGYATEAAMASLSLGFNELRLNEIVSAAVVANLRSRRVMERLGMTHNPEDDFDHPMDLPAHLRAHVLYRLARSAWSGVS